MPIVCLSAYWTQPQDISETCSVCLWALIHCKTKKKRERTCIHFQAAFLATVMGRFPLKVKGLKVLTSSVWWRTFTKHFLWKCSGNAVSWNNPTFSCFNIWQREDKKVPRGFEQTSKYRWSINVALRQPVSVHERQCVCSLSVLSISYCRLNYAVVAMLPATQLICMCDSISLCVWKAKKKKLFWIICVVWRSLKTLYSTRTQLLQKRGIPLSHHVEMEKAPCL